MIYQILFKHPSPVILEPIHYRLLKTPLELEAAFFHLLATDVCGEIINKIISLFVCCFDTYWY